MNPPPPPNKLVPRCLTCCQVQPHSKSYGRLRARFEHVSGIGISIFRHYWSQWPRGLRRRSASARLLGLRVRIPPVTWIFVTCECCVLSGRGFCVGLITYPEESYRAWCVWVWLWSLDNQEVLAHLGLLHYGGKKKLQTLIAKSPNCVVVWKGRSKPTAWTSPHLPRLSPFDTKTFDFLFATLLVCYSPTFHLHAM